MAFMAVVIFCSAPLLGGHLGRLAAIRLRHPLLIVVALVVQILISNVIPEAPRALLVPLHLATYAAAAGFLWANRRIPGLVLIGAGAMTNAVVIALNGGTLPASARALQAAGWSPTTGDFANSGVVAHPVLPWLGDIAATPSWLPFQNVISVGDMLVLLGTVVLVHGVTGSRLGSLLARGVPGGAARLQLAAAGPEPHVPGRHRR